MTRRMLAATLRYGLFMLAISVAPPQPMHAQQKSTQPLKPGTSSASKQASTQQVPPAPPVSKDAPPNTPTDPSAADAQAKDALMQSARWQQAVREFHNWLSVQTLYNEEQVAEMRRDLAIQIDRMSHAELEQALAQMEARLAVLLSDEAQDARAWVAQYLSVLAARPREQFKAGLPDVRNLTAAQLQQELAQIQQRRATRRQGQTALEQARNQRVQNVRQQRATPSSTGQSTGDPSAAARFNPVQSDFSPRQYEPGFMRRNTFYVNPWGGVGIGLTR